MLFVIIRRYLPERVSLLSSAGKLCLSPEGTYAASPGASDMPEKTVPQGQDPPGADNGEQPIPPQAEHKEVIPPPPIGDEDIYTKAPNPDAGHEEEVIPPPAPDEDPSITPH
jgi:hypothetical protein